jgi:hypothetical protein
MPRGQSHHKVSHLKPSPKRKPTKHTRVEEIEQAYQPYSRQPITLPIVRWLGKQS